MTVMARAASPMDPFTVDDLNSMLGGRRHELIDGSLIVTGEPPLTPADLERLRVDERRYELVDGSLIKTPAPTPIHQLAQMGLIRTLMPHCPAELSILAAPLDVHLDELTVVQPDLLVARRVDVGPTKLESTPLLVVEILSPSTRILDRKLKRELYARSGCPSYWIVDPDLPSITVLSLEDGVYEELGQVEGSTAIHVGEPFGVTLVPTDLTQG